MARTFPVEIADRVYLPEGLPGRLERELAARLTFDNPDPTREQVATYRGRTCEKLTFVMRRPDGSLRIPRGAFETLRGLAREYGVPLKFVSRVTTNGRPARALAEVIAPGEKLRDYQEEAVRAMLGRLQGQVLLPCGGGKTVIGAAACLAADQPSLVLCHATRIAEQWVTAFQRFSGGGRTVRMIGGDSDDEIRPMLDGEVTVALVQSLVQQPEASRALLASAGTLLQDEAHRSPSDTTAVLLESCPARYRWGLTATPDRPDGYGFLLRLLFGPVLLERKVHELVAAGHLRLPTIVPVHTGWTPSPKSFDKNGRPDWNKSIGEMTSSADRTELLVSLAEAVHRADWRTLILVPRIEYTDVIVARLRQRGVLAYSLTSHVSQADQERRMRQFQKGMIRTIIATKIADEGLDVPELTCMINAAAGRADGVAVQRAGRSMRPAGDRDPLIFELVDGGFFRSQWSARARAYRQQVGANPTRAVDGLQGALDLLARLQAA